MYQLKIKLSKSPLSSPVEMDPISEQQVKNKLIYDNG